MQEVEVGMGGGASSQVSLSPRAFEFAKGGCLGFGLNPLGDNREAECLTKRDDRFDDGGVAPRAAHAVDERSIDLQLVDRIFRALRA